MGLEVWKFGGAALASAVEVRAAARLVGQHAGPLVVVVSALAGVTDGLLEGAVHAAAGRTAEARRHAALFLRRHRDIITAIAPPGPERRRMLRAADAAAREYRDICAAIALLRHLPPRVRDLVLARGERISAQIVAAALRRAGTRAGYADALDIMATDDRHSSAAPDASAIRRRARTLLGPELAAGRVPVVPGFIGRAPDGSITTLGRGGSDVTATSLGRALNAVRVVLWKDVPGILTADPRLVPDARVIPRLHRLEAAEVAYFGAKVLHPRALIPLSGARTTLLIRSFAEPSLPGTEVAARRQRGGQPVKAVAAIGAQAIVTVAGRGMAGVHGIAARAFAAVDSERLSVSTIFQASSESSIGFALAEADGERVVRRLRETFAHELATRMIDDVASAPGMAVVAVVGDAMVGTPGIAGRVFSALADARVNVVAIAQGSSERNISFVVKQSDMAAAVRCVHDEFQLSKIGGGSAAVPKGTDLVLLGFGRVGRALTDLITARKPRGPRIRVLGVLDRSGYVFDPDGISRRRLLELTRAKDDGAGLASLGGRRATAAEALADISAHAASRPVIVDVTSDATGEVLCRAMRDGYSVVLANKRPLTESWAKYSRLIQACGPGHTMKYEATVGAGLPIIDTFFKLVDTGDRVLCIEGCVSGTLTFVLAAVSRGERFSDAVKRAVDLGFAEPDPREDLSGRDAARKCLILARLMGYRGAAPAPESLVPRGLAGGTVQEFYRRMAAGDAAWQARANAARTRHRVLRYMVRATPRSVSAGLREVPIASAAGSLEGTRNLIAFTTERYGREPIVVSGSGAGPAVTAAGVLNDIQSLGRRE